MLTVITGCMFSGKSTELIRRVNCLRSIGENVLVINHASDNRYTDSEAVVSHSGRTMTSLKVKRLTGIGHLGYGVIAIDEAQFFPDLVNAVLGIENGKRLLSWSYWRFQLIMVIYRLCPTRMIPHVCMLSVPYAGCNSSCLYKEDN